MKQYTKIKEFHVNWIGKIPNDWSTKKLKFSVFHKTQKSKKNSSTLPYVGLENVESDTGRLIDTDEEMEESNAKLFLRDDVLFGKLRPYLAKVTKPDFDGRCSGEFLVFNGKEYENNFLKFLLISHGSIKTIDASTYGAKMPRAEWEFIGNMVFPIPKKIIQTQIANFLEQKVSKINSDIKNNHKLIKLLKEKKNSIITQTVTKGINSSAPTKNSGITWIEKIPKEWQIIPIKYTCSLITDGSHYSPEKLDEGYPMATVENMEKDSINIDTCYKIDKHDYDILVSNNCQPKINDILFSKDGTVGNSLVFTQSDKVVLLSSIAIIRTKEFLNPFYCNFILQSNFLKFQYNRLKEGAALKRIILEKIRNFKILLPSLKEQEQIAEFLEQETSKINLIISQSESQIEKLQEYRQSLISNAVTGKVDVSCA